MTLQVCHASGHFPVLFSWGFLVIFQSTISAQQPDQGETFLSTLLQPEQLPRDGQSNLVPFSAIAHVVMASL